MNYEEFSNRILQCGLSSSNWLNMLNFLSSLLNSTSDKEQYLKIFNLYFSLIDDGNVYMSLDESILTKKLSDKINGLKAEAEEDSKQDLTQFDELEKEVNAVIKNIAVIRSCPLIGPDDKDHLFVIEDDNLFTRKHFNAVCRINNSVDRLFKNNSSIPCTLDYSQEETGFLLSKGQDEAVQKGIYNNLLITGGPGTGKTTSVIFILMALLNDNPDLNIYLTAPSGKAASRIKESILKNISSFKPDFKTKNQSVIDKINGLDNYTIHRLLGYSNTSKAFKHNAKNQFEADSIFIIDEASMIDVNLFASLLDSIPSEARVFILGDKNQLPSVECGAVFGALLLRPALKENIIEIDVSQRFDNTTKIYELSEKINSGSDLSYIAGEWQSYNKFAVSTNGKDFPIFYYNDNAKNNTKMIEEIADAWYAAFFDSTNWKTKCNDIDLKTVNSDYFETINDISESAKILCASNEGARGINHVNKYLLEKYYSNDKRISGYYVGEPIIVTKNNHPLDLYNGDCGVTVMFKDDDTLYLMLKKSSQIDFPKYKVENQVFSIDDYMFYPMRLINSADVDTAFAITIHKSQGSDYKNILVILPKTKGHPLLNRQIVYTAITRTKGSTYILSNQENLEAASKSVITRDTF